MRVAARRVAPRRLGCGPSVGGGRHHGRMAWTFDAELWPHGDGAEGSWVFLTVPEEVGEEIRALSGPPRGFGSVRVEATLGPTTWRTSVFPDKARGYVLPVKKPVRRAAGVDVGDTAAVELRLV